VRVLVVTFGTRGDVQPMLALSLGLRASGDEVTVALPPNAVEWARSLGLQAHGVGVDFEVAMRHVGTSPRKALPIMQSEIAVHARELRPLVEGADRVVSASVYDVAVSLAEARGIPYRHVALSPQVLPSGEHPFPGLPMQDMPRWFNRFTWWMNGGVWKLWFRSRINAARRDLGLAPVLDVYRQRLSPGVIVASEPALSPIPADVDVPATQVGTFFLRDERPLPADVERFLAAGPPPVYAGFGSMPDGDPGRTRAVLAEAARQAGVRLLVGSGWAGLTGEQAVGDVNHAALFARCAVVVHHGGAGTTATALRAGVPQVVVPHVFDQFYWASRALRAGVSGGTVPRGQLGAARLAGAIRQALALGERARAVATTVDGRGVERGVGVLC